MQTTQRLPQEDSLNTVQQIQRVSKVDSAEGNQVETIYYGTVNDDQIWATSPDLNLFYAGAGNDHLHGSAGRDIMKRPSASLMQSNRWPVPASTWQNSSMIICVTPI